MNLFQFDSIAVQGNHYRDDSPQCEWAGKEAGNGKINKAILLNVMEQFI